MINFLLGVAATVLAYTFAPPEWAAFLSAKVRLILSALRDWWERLDA